MQLTHRIIVIFVLSALFVTGCGDGTGNVPPTVNVTDDLGRSVPVPADIERVVTIAPNLTEILFTAGAGHKLVGVTTADHYPPAVDSLPHFGALPLDFEAIAALAPDLVLANDNVNNPRDAETFEALDIPILYFTFQTLDDLFESIRTLGDLLGTSDHAEAAADSLENVVATLRQRTADVDEHPLTLFLVGDEVLYSFGSESYMHALIELAGGRSATGTMEAVRPVLSDEFVLTTKPDVIIGAFGEDYDPARLLELHPTWDIVPAVRNHRIYSLDPDLALRPTPRLLEGVRQMAQYLHPSLFPASEASATPSETP